MPKRFTATEKWADPWYRRLSCQAKQLWGYLLDHCDNIGLVEMDFSLISSDCGQKIDQSHVAELGDRVQLVDDKKLFIPKFIRFQYGELNPSCPPHRTIIKAVTFHGLIRSGFDYYYPNARVSNFPYPNARVDTTLKTRQDKTRQEEEKEPEEEKGSSRVVEPPFQPKGNTPSPSSSSSKKDVKYHKDARAFLHFLNETVGRHFRETDPNLTIISARLSEPEVDLEGCKTMLLRQHKKWKGTEFQDYLQPATLFRASKFDGYYAAKDQPIYETKGNGPSGDKRFDRNKGTLNEGHAERYDLKKIQAARALRDNPPSQPGANA